MDEGIRIEQRDKAISEQNHAINQDMARREERVEELRGDIAQDRLNRRYDRDEFDRDEYDRDGYDQRGYGRDGWGRDGYNRDGYHRDGYHRDDYGRYLWDDGYYGSNYRSGRPARRY